MQRVVVRLCTCRNNGRWGIFTAYARDEGQSASLRSASGAYAVYDGLLF